MNKINHAYVTYRYEAISLKHIQKIYKNQITHEFGKRLLVRSVEVTFIVQDGA